MHAISPGTLKRLLADDGREIALLDIREFGEYGMGHPFHAVNLPFSRLEALAGGLVPRRTAPIVVLDDHGEGRGQRAAQCLADLGYRDVAWLEGGAQGWQAAGYGLFAGVNVVSKTFGELVHEHFHTPGVAAATLDEWQRTGKPVHVIDGRPVAEYRKMNIPASICCPNGELAKRLPTLLAGDTTTPVVINCAGRTRSIIGAQTLRWLGIENPVYALENGTQGWRLAGLSLEHDSRRDYPAEIAAGTELGAAARRLAESGGAQAIDAATLDAWLADETRTTYVFDVRTAEEHRRDAPAGAIHAPGGQLIQATDHWVGVQRARLVLLDDDECRAPVVAHWLALMGQEVAWLRGGSTHWPALQNLSRRGDETALPMLPPALDLAEALDPARLCLDARPGMQYRAGHLPGARWVNRALLDEQLAEIDTRRDIVLVADAERATCLAIELAWRGITPVGWLAPALDDWQSSGVTLARTPDEPDDAHCIDFLFFVHDRHDGNLEASRRYLAWETGLLERLDAQERATFTI
ncbi:rhodanese-like domain-containing protein [Modicisalibacter coralii]|uniref:rhodanese-like domain-containing protein n=1 Tax=Modicisalibacter coralii TaxID=2304602 RepID=UPI00100A922E|nr:rhodanese-like domain-containing protein [Halomonas coralii]